MTSMNCAARRPPWPGSGRAVGSVNPRPPGWQNDLIQLVKKLLARSLDWHTRPLREFNASVSRSLEEIVSALDHLSTNMVAVDQLSTNTRLNPWSAFRWT